VYYNLHRAVKRIPPGEVPLPAGIYEYPFIFHIPKNLPPSLKTPLGEVYHRLRASLKRPGHVPTLLYRIAKADACTKLALTVHNSDHTTFPQTPDRTVRAASPGDPPAYSSNRLEWCGQRRNGQIDWVVQAPASTHISHRADVLAKITMAKGYGIVESATVDLVQIERYQAEPDPTVWTYPVRRELFEEDDDINSSSDDGFPETRSRGISLRQGVSLAPLGGAAAHTREKVSSDMTNANDSVLWQSNQSPNSSLRLQILTTIRRDIASTWPCPSSFLGIILVCSRLTPRL